MQAYTNAGVPDNCGVRCEHNGRYPLSDVGNIAVDSMMALERRKKEMEREREFKLTRHDVGYAERRFQQEVAGLAGRQQAQPQPLLYGAPPPEMAHNRYQKIYELDGPIAAQWRPPQATLLPTKWAPRKLLGLNEDEKNVVKRCVRCVAEGGYINNAGDFRGRIGFHRGDVKRLYAMLCRDGGDWSHIDTTSNMWYLINNCMHEIVNNNLCVEWGRWFGSVSRRKVEDLYIKLDGPGKMLTRYNGRTIELSTPGI